VSRDVPPRGSFLAIAALSLGTAVTAIDGHIVAPALPTLAQDFGVDQSTSVLLVTSYQLVFLMALLPFSALGDRLGHLRIYRIGQVSFALASGLCYFAETFSHLLILRAVQALGAAASLSVSAALIKSVYPPSRLGRGMGVNSTIVAVGTASAPLLGALLLSVGHWRWMFAAAAPFALLSLLFGLSIPRSPARSKSFDLLGAVICASTFGLLGVGLGKSVEGGSAMAAAALIGAGLLLGTLFVRRELGRERPILPLDLLRKPDLALSVVATLTAFMAAMMMFVSLPFRLQSDYGYSPVELGVVIAAWPLTMVVVAPIAGELSDRFSSARLSAIGMMFAAAAIASFALLPADPRLGEMVLRMALCGAGFGLFFPPNSRLILASAPPARSASAGSLISTVRLIGQALGATFASALLALGLGTGIIPALVAASLAVAAALVSLSRARAGARTASPP
jgi:DHA2 family multidrug resistance protein-like MFS transporter